MNYVLIVLLVAIGLYDLYLVVKKHPTLSQQYQKLFPKWLDMIIFGITLYVLLTSFMWVDWRLKVVIGMFAGHVLFPNKETYEK